ncbi:MAG: phosphatase PAP2 family protein [Ignavibacteria bacterium]|jgi:membrane-associated phospholipid phosphatase|nr:phosphatase PAP2 family protein [Ignavibacteria bacterium]
MKLNQKIIPIFLAFLFCSAYIFGQDTNDYKSVQFLKLFHNFGNNTLHSVTHNYGANYALGALGTYALIESGIDWKWNRIAYNNQGLAYAGMPSGLIGFVAPIGVPLYMYFHGENIKDSKMQIAGLAVGQAAILGVGISSIIKAFTGRKAPGILDKNADTNDYSNDWDFGFMERGVFNGWPSSHTAVAVAMATTLAEIYPENSAVQIGAIAYSIFIGAGMSVNAHWLSDVVAGALVGYAIGKSVGYSFNQLLNDDKKDIEYSIYPTFGGIGITISLR